MLISFFGVTVPRYLVVFLGQISDPVNNISPKYLSYRKKKAPAYAGANYKQEDI
jgi:hypothetical protein